MEKKKLIELLGSLFIAFIFLSSYATMTSSPQKNSTKSTTTIPVALGTGFTKCKIVNYTPTFTVVAHCSASLLNSTLGKLQASGAVAEYVPVSNTSYDVYAGNESSYDLMQHLASMGNCFNISATAILAMPPTINLYIGALNRTFPVKVPVKLSQLQTPVKFGNESSFNVSVMALVTLAGTIYQPNITIYNMSVQVEK